MAPRFLPWRCFLALALLYSALTRDPALVQLVPMLVGAFFLALAVMFAYWTWGCTSLRYVVDRNALQIRWGNVQQVVPIGNIEKLIPGDADEPADRGRELEGPPRRTGRSGRLWARCCSTRRTARRTRCSTC